MSNERAQKLSKKVGTKQQVSVLFSIFWKITSKRRISTKFVHIRKITNNNFMIILFHRCIDSRNDDLLIDAEHWKHDDAFFGYPDAAIVFVKHDKKDRRTQLVYNYLIAIIVLKDMKKFQI